MQRKKKKEKNYTIVGDLIERLPEMVDIIHIKRKKKTNTIKNEILGIRDSMLCIE